jgi:hypothetical protein
VPDSDALRLAFTRTDHRMQRKSDGTVVIEGRRFDIPNRYRHLTRLEVRYAGWDLGLVHLVDERTGTVLTRLYPQDKTRNASGLRRTLSSVANGSATPMPTDVEPATGLPPLLARMLDQQAGAQHPRFRALALFGRRLSERGDSLGIPASENLHTTGIPHRSKEQVGRSDLGVIEVSPGF